MKTAVRMTARTIERFALVVCCRGLVPVLVGGIMVSSGSLSRIEIKIIDRSFIFKW